MNFGNFLIQNIVEISFSPVNDQPISQFFPTIYWQVLHYFQWNTEEFHVFFSMCTKKFQDILLQTNFIIFSYIDYEILQSLPVTEYRILWHFTETNWRILQFFPHGTSMKLTIFFCNPLMNFTMFSWSASKELSNIF